MLGVHACPIDYLEQSGAILAGPSRALRRDEVDACPSIIESHLEPHGRVEEEVEEEAKEAEEDVEEEEEEEEEEEQCPAQGVLAGLSRAWQGFAGPSRA